MARGVHSFAAMKREEAKAARWAALAMGSAVTAELMAQIGDAADAASYAARAAHHAARAWAEVGYVDDPDLNDTAATYYAAVGAARAAHDAALAGDTLSAAQNAAEASRLIAEAHFGRP